MATGFRPALRTQRACPALRNSFSSMAGLFFLLFAHRYSLWFAATGPFALVFD
jgi:hypothetical protein